MQAEVACRTDQVQTLRHTESSTVVTHPCPWGALMLWSVWFGLLMSMLSLLKPLLSMLSLLKPVRALATEASPAVFVQAFLC